MEVNADLRYLEPKKLAVDGTNCEGLTVRTTTGKIGGFQGFLVDPVAHRLRFVVFELLGRLRLLPVTIARIDLVEGAIELLDQVDVRVSKPFRRELFPTF